MLFRSASRRNLKEVGYASGFPGGSGQSRLCGSKTPSMLRCAEECAAENAECKPKMRMHMYLKKQETDVCEDVRKRMGFVEYHISERATTPRSPRSALRVVAIIAKGHSYFSSYNRMITYNLSDGQSTKLATLPYSFLPVSDPRNRAERARLPISPISPPRGVSVAP